MSEKAVFRGFPKQTVKFFRDLAKHNDKAWFAAHRAEYDAYVLAPAQAFVMAMGEKLREISPGIHADPRIDRSIFRLYRDTRFTNDKSPFKTHLGIYFWEGDRPKMECSGFYFHVEPPNLLLGAGLYLFPPALLEEYRRSVVHPVHGEALADAIKLVTKRGYFVGEPHYKRTPRGYDPAHPRAPYLLYNGLWAGMEERLPDLLYSADLIAYCIKHYRALAPLHQWQTAMIERA
jgi:uncharacterized protein (TIGR02453 family)